MSGDKTQDSKGLNDYWIVKTSADGISCNVPVNLRTENVGTDEARLKWDKAVGVNNYSVAYRIVFSPEWTIVSAANNSKYLDGLSPDTEYNSESGPFVMGNRWFNPVGQ